jgi:hypothetical protein
MLEHFKKVCPNPTIIDPDEVKDALRDASAATLIQAWINRLERTEDRCVEIKAHTMQVFDFWCVFRPFSGSTKSNLRGKGYLVTRLGCSTYGLRSPNRQS